MATTPATTSTQSGKFVPSRAQLQTITKNPVMLIALENLFKAAFGEQGIIQDVTDVASVQATEALDAIAILAAGLSEALSQPPLIQIDPNQIELFPPSNNGNMADQNRDRVDITGGSIVGVILGLLRLTGTLTPVNNGDLAFETTSNTTFTIKFKGSDGVVRQNALTLT